jgi:hypothetical protein
MTTKTVIGTTGVWDFYDTNTGKYLYSYKGFLSKKSRIKFNRDGFIYVNFSTNFTPCGVAPTKRVFNRELQKALSTELENN